MTLALRTRLTVFYTLVFGVVLAAIGAIAYRALAEQLDSDATTSLMELTSGLHGYLHFENGAATRVLRSQFRKRAACFLRSGSAFASM